MELDRESLGDSETVNLDEGDDLVSIENPSLNTLNCSFSQEKPTDEGESPEAGLAITDFSKQIFVFSEAGKPIFTRFGWDKVM